MKAIIFDAFGTLFKVTNGGSAKTIMRNITDCGVRIDEKAFLERFEAITQAFKRMPGYTGYCYTQLTDVEQEVNGLYTYQREVKFDPAIFKAVLQRKAACEE